MAKSCIADGKDETNDMTYGWLAVMKFVDPTATLGWQGYLAERRTVRSICVILRFTQIIPTHN